MRNEEIVKEMISKVNVEDLVDIIYESTSVEKDNIDLNWHLNKWACNKIELYKLMGHNLKKESVIDSQTSESEIRLALKGIVCKYSVSLPACVAVLNNVLDNEEIVSNRLLEDRVIFGTKFQKGTKLFKVLSKLSSDSAEISNLQTDLSMIIQELRSAGTAVISIDPIDYLTMSANNSQWRSCHDIMSGEFKAGCLSYMCDESTMIAYVKKKTNARIGKVEFPSKIWRQCVYVSDNFDYAIQTRQYPCINKNNRKAISELLAEMLNIDSFKVYFISSDESFTENLVSDEKCRYEEPCHYNDILRGSVKQYSIVSKQDLTIDTDWSMSVGTCFTGVDVYYLDGEKDYIREPSILALEEYDDCWYDDDDF